MATRTLRGKDPKQAKPSKPKILIYGPPGVGKTWGALDFPSAYYIDTEGGANLDHYTEKLRNSGGAYLGIEDGSLDFDVVTDEIIALATTQHGYRTLIIDSFTKIFNAKVAESLEKMGVTEDKSTFGKEKLAAVRYCRKWVETWFPRLDMNVILICHQKDKWLNGEAVGQTFDGWDKLEYELHLNLQIIKQGANRKAKVTKTRLAEFKDGEVFDWSYTTFAAKYGVDVLEASATAVDMASAEQIEQYDTLLETVKVDAKVLEKWADAAATPAELTSEDIQKRIDWLTAQLNKAKG